MKLGLSQIPLVDEIEANHQKALRMIRAAAQAGAQRICFPELQLIRFFPQYQGLDASKWALRWRAHTSGGSVTLVLHQSEASGAVFVRIGECHE